MMPNQWRPPTAVREARLLPTRRLDQHPGGIQNRVGRAASTERLSRNQIAAIREAMHLFVEDDVSRGLSLDQRRYCDACERQRTAAGFVCYGRYLVCNICATEYEVANARGLTVSIGQYVRDKHFGEAAHYSLEQLPQD